MECWIHTGVEASGVCVHCGTAGCRHCLTMFRGALVCRSCGARLAGPPADAGGGGGYGPTDPRTLKIASLVTAGAFLVMGVATLISLSADPKAPPTPPGFVPFALAVYAWMGWSVAWTLPPILKWLHARAVRPVVFGVENAQPGCLLSGLFGLFTLALLWYLLFMPAFAVALVYGVFGGGIRERIRCRAAWADEKRQEAGSPPPGTQAGADAGSSHELRRGEPAALERVVAREEDPRQRARRHRQALTVQREFLVRKGVTLDQLAEVLKQHFKDRYQVWAYDAAGVKGIWVKKNAHAAARLDFLDRSRVTGSKFPDGPEVSVFPRRPPSFLPLLIGFAVFLPPLRRGSHGVSKEVEVFLSSETTLLRDNQPPARPLDEKRVQTLIARFNSQSTDELSTAVSANDTAQWAPEALEAMRRILDGRR